MDHRKAPNRGRPSLGMEAKASVAKVRLDSYTNQRLIRDAKLLGITKAEVIRQGILLYLDKMETAYPELKCN